MPEAPLSPSLLENVLARLGLPISPAPTLDGLRILYAAWCQRVPFDNVQKLIHVRSQNPGPLPGSTAENFFENWLQHGTGGTCWSGAGALHALLTSLGFPAQRGIGTMLIAPDVPPNHGTVRVRFEGNDEYLVDSSVLHHEPLRLSPAGMAQISHPAWGVRASRQQNLWHVHWRPLHMTDGFVCRYENLDLPQEEFQDRYEKTRAWSPFNYQLTARLNRGDEVLGLAFGNSVRLRKDGHVTSHPPTVQERHQLLIEDLGLSEEIVSRLPADIPTPPPPGSRTAREQGL